MDGSFFSRVDETDDAAFYAEPRLVTHIDDDAIAAVGELYEELGIDGDVLDLMSSWVSHFATPPRQPRVLGMNEYELRSEPRRGRAHRPRPQRRPDAAVAEREHRRRRVLRVGRLPHAAGRRSSATSRGCCGRAVGSCARSATACSRRRRSAAGLYGTDEDRCAIVAEYFRASRVFDSPTISRRSPDGHQGDPLFAVWATRL